MNERMNAYTYAAPIRQSPQRR